MVLQIIFAGQFEVGQELPFQWKSTSAGSDDLVSKGDFSPKLIWVDKENIYVILIYELTNNLHLKIFAPFTASY